MFFAPHGGDNRQTQLRMRGLEQKLVEYLRMLPTAEESGDLCIEPFCPYRHLRRMKWVLHHSLGVDLVHFLQHCVCCWFDERSEEDKLGS